MSTITKITYTNPGFLISKTTTPKITPTTVVFTTTAVVNAGKSTPTHVASTAPARQAQDSSSDKVTIDF